MNRTQPRTDTLAAPFTPQGNVRLINCPACGINTNHKQIANGNWICWCGTETTQAELDARPQWKAEDILRREG